jgi:2'-5' RNA ligase
VTEPIRAFLAFELPLELLRRLAVEREALRRELPQARWVRPEGVHATLKFLGDTPAEVLERLAGELAPRLAGRGPVQIRLTGAGFFPSLSRARVAWLGGEAPGADEIAAVVDRVASEHGFPAERRPWSLHLTLARLDSPWPRPAVERFLQWGQELDLAPVRCQEVVLFSSRLEPGGAVYTALKRLRLE